MSRASPASRFGLAVLVIGAAVIGSWFAGWLQVPDRWNPWAPLTLKDRPNFLTGYKLTRLEQDAPACQAALQTTALRYLPQPDRDGADGCGWRHAVRITATPSRVSQPFVLECSAAMALALWERHTLQPLARLHLGAEVVRIDHLGSYACRNIGGEDGARRSEHASANAFDVAGFLLADGRSVRVAADWSRGDDARSRFLHELHDGACRYWNVVLGPDYNAAHRDHLHLDRGRYRACR
jgi:hypothetical protein